MEGRARFFSGAGADVLVLAATTGSEDYGEAAELDGEAWEALFESLVAAEEIAADTASRWPLHPHFGTVIETDDQLRRFLEGWTRGFAWTPGTWCSGAATPSRSPDWPVERVNHVHLKDVDSKPPAGSAREMTFKEAAGGLFRPLGEGDVDLEGGTGPARTLGLRGWYVLEQDTVVENEPAEARGPSSRSARA